MTNIILEQDRSLIRKGARSKRYLAAQLQLPAKEKKEGESRPPVRIAFVIDRSGSMAGQKLRLACEAVDYALGLLAPSDRFAVVVYDDEVNVVVPLSPADNEAVLEARRRLRALETGGCTDLYEGWLRGCEQIAEETETESIVRTILLTDGLANRGLTDPRQLVHHAGELKLRGISTTTMGLGDDFNERLLNDMATAASGNFYFIEQAQQIRDFFASELGEALDVVAKDAKLLIDAPRGVDLEIISSFRSQYEGSKLVVHLGDLVSRQSLDVVIQARFSKGKAGELVPIEAQLADADGRLEGSARVEFRYADHRSNDGQERNRLVDRLVATAFAAHAQQECLDLNSRGRYREAAAVLRGVASKISSYAGDDSKLRQICYDMAESAPLYEAAISARQRKHEHWRSARSLKGRDGDGSARRS